MPVYEFACNACGAKVSVFVRSINSPLNASCEKCGSMDLRRLISKFAVVHSMGGLQSLDGLPGYGPGSDDMASMMGGEYGPEMQDMMSRMQRGESFDSFDDGFDRDHGED